MKASVAIDSLPISDCIFTAYDYSGLQVHGLSHTSLGALIRRGASLSTDGLRARIDIPRDLMWSNGQRVTATHYLNGIRRVAGQNPFVGKVLFRKIKTLAAGDDGLELELHRPNFEILEILSIPNFCPIDPSQTDAVSSGRYVMHEATKGRYELMRSPTLDARDEQPDRLTVTFLDGPEANMLAFERREIDVTSDTAFPFERLDSYRAATALRRHDSGLFCILTFGGDLAETTGRDTRRAVLRELYTLTFDEILRGACPRVSNFFDGARSGEIMEGTPHALSCELVLSYDPFYPNLQVCQAIQARLAAGGFTVSLVADDYYRPHARFDMKLSIFRGLGNSAYLRYLSLLFSMAVQKDRKSQLAGFSIVETIETSERAVERLAAYQRLQALFDESAFVVPLFAIPGYYLSRLNNAANPLLEGALRS